jgi:cobalt/nickel transport system ATP-binding protein
MRLDRNTMAEPVFTLNNAGYSYSGNIPALKGITLAINKGDRVAIIGANGTGKSTLLTLLDALIFPNTGSITAFGNELTERAMRDAAVQREFRRRVGFVFQNPDIQLFCPTVREDIVFGPLQLGMGHDEIRIRLAGITEKIRISHLLDRSPHQLSIGEKKKAAIASVLIMEPDVLLLDEPTAGLDPQTMRDIIDVIDSAHKAGRTVVMATHDLHIVEEIADIVHVFGGEKTIIRSGSAEEILADNEFLQKNNLVHIHVHRHMGVKHVHPHDHGHTHEQGPSDPGLHSHPHDHPHDHDHPHSPGRDITKFR